MKKFLKNGLLFFALLLTPALFMTFLYIYFDPFKVVKKYEYSAYLDTYIPPNRDFLSTELFLANKGKYKYNSFIFGSSRAASFSPDSWSKHLNRQAVPFVFDATGESLFGIYTKLKFLENEKTDLDNVLILFCRNAFFNDKNYIDHLKIKHPQVTGESWIKFHFSFFKAYFNLKFLAGYYSFLITGKQTLLTHGIMRDLGFSINYKTNQMRLDGWENELIKGQKEFYESRRDIFYKRNGESFESEQKIKENHIKMLKEIKQILERNHSNFKIILTPMYDQVKFSVRDKEILLKIFGDHLYDFTGKNFITENDTNWYETNHFRLFVADSIMNIIYSGSNSGHKWR